MNESGRPLAHARHAFREGSSGDPVRKPAADVDMRLSVAFAPHPDRLQALLGAYVEGPGRTLFAPSPAEWADTMIADIDHAPARAAMLRYREATGHPCIVLAQHDPRLPGAAWVPKPVSFEGLARAAAVVQALRAAAAGAKATEGAEAQASASASAQLLARMVLATDTSRLPPPVGAQDVPVRPSAGAAGAAGAGAVAPAGASTAGARGPAVVARSRSRFVGPGPETRTRKSLWMALGIAGILSIATSLGWAPEGTLGRRNAEAVTDTARGEAQRHAEDLKAAVQASLRDYRMRTPAEERLAAYHAAQVRALREDSPGTRRPGVGGSPPEPPARNRVVLAGTPIASDATSYLRLNLRAAVALSAPGAPAPAQPAPRLMPLPPLPVAPGCDFMLDGRCMSLARVRPQE